MLRQIAGFLTGRELDSGVPGDAQLVISVSGKYFKSIPKVYRCSPRLLKGKQSDEIYGVMGFYDETENVAYVMKDSNHIAYEFGKLHELGHAQFAQNSVLEEEFRKDDDIAWTMAPAFHYEWLSRYFTGEQVPQAVDYPNILARMTAQSIDEGFANLLAHECLTQRWGRKGSMEASLRSLYDTKHITAPPYSPQNLVIILRDSGTVYANHLKIAVGLPDAFSHLLNISKLELPKARLEIIEKYSKFKKSLGDK